MEGFQEEVATIITHYGVLLADIIGTGFCPASLAYLVRFWQDPIPEIQQAARSLFRATVSRWSAKTRTRAVAYWAAKLRARDAESPRAVVVLAALASGDKAGVDPRTCAEVAGALISMAAEGRTAFRVAALELLGRGFTAWEPHISATGLIRYVEQIAGFLPMIPGSGDAGGSAPPQQPASVQQMARQAILSIATSSTPVFVQTLVLDLTHAKSPDERRGCLRLVSVFVSKKPSVLQPHLLRVAEGIIKCLEPTNPQLRESLLPSVTAALHDLVRTYPSVTFHGPTQHLAVGDLDGPVVVFDLKTGGRYQVLEGHEKPVTAVALSPSGRVAASYSGEEGSVLIYYLTTSLFGLLTGVGSGSGIKPIRASKFLAVEKARVGWASCKLEFTSERTLKLTGAGAAHELEF